MAISFENSHCCHCYLDFMNPSPMEDSTMATSLEVIVFH